MRQCNAIISIFSITTFVSITTYRSFVLTNDCTILNSKYKNYLTKRNVFIFDMGQFINNCIGFSKQTESMCSLRLLLRNFCCSKLKWIPMFHWEHYRFAFSILPNVQYITQRRNFYYKCSAINTFRYCIIGLKKSHQLNALSYTCLEG